ncbi:MAG: hypothetical protein ACXWEY_11570 [Bacteroidia bacterium]
MGCDCFNTLSPTARKKEVQDFLTILGFEKYSHDCFAYFDKKSREQITGVSATIINKRPIVVFTRTNIWRTIKDHEIHNWTIKELKNRFGGHFDSDEGKNRYLKFSGSQRRKAEAGCDLAYYDFRNNIATLHGFLSIIKNSEKSHPIDDITRYFNPLIASSNIGLPFMISVMEEYLRAAYISLLIYSPNKKEIFKRANIQTEELFDVTENKSTLEEVIARFKSFQNIELINKNFKEFSNDLSFIDTLKRYNPKRKYHEKLATIIVKRHEMIHRFSMDFQYTLTEFKRDLDLVEKVVQIFHDRIIAYYKWNKREW